MRFEIVSIQSAGNSVTVANADNNGNGTTNAAVFDYSQLVGNSLAANAESGNKTIRFNNPNTVLFSFTARVKAHTLNGSSVTGGSTTGTTTTSGTSTTGGTSTGGTTTNSASGTISPSRLLKFTVNPLTGTVSVTLLQ
jgi:hypothetical protein